MFFSPGFSVSIFFLLILFIHSSNTSAQSTPAFWQVDDEDSQIFLLGSMHFGSNDFYPLPKEIEIAYRQAEALAVEVDISSINPSSMGRILHDTAGLPEGETLKQVLGTQVFSQLSQYCDENHVSLDAWESWQPWFIALQLIQIELARSPWQASNGVDMHFLQKKDKPVIELESIESQFSIFSELTFDEQRFFLKQTLGDLQRSADYLSSMANAWKSGDLGKLETLLLSAFLQSEGSKRLYEKIITERNAQMTEKASEFLTENKKVFLMVGAGHMVGEKGIVAELQRRGYRVKRIQYDL